MALSASTEPQTPVSASPRSTADLLDRVGALNLSDLQETAWIEVIRKMEEVYSDLIRYEVDLERKNAALEQAQRFIESVLASMSDVLIICDSRARIQQVNSALLDLTGHDESDLLGLPFATLLPFTDRNLVECFAELTAKGTLRDHEARFLAKNGDPTDPVALNCSLRRDSKGMPAGYVIIGRPVGELRRAYEALNAAHADLKAAQQQLVQSEKMASLGRLIAGVAHELNNPASFVLGNSHALEHYAGKMGRYLAAIHGGATPKARETLRQELGIDAMLADLTPLIDGTREGAERIADIVKNLRRFSFSNAGGQAPFDLAEVARTAAHWAARGRKRAVPVDLHLPEQGLTLHGHAGSIHQVMVNLVQNALDAVEETEKPRIGIALRQEGKHAVVMVTDNGPGIPSEYLLKVFDPFFTSKPVGHGTGLGLWISYTIIKDHGGAIEAGNRPEGGAALIFTLPI